MTDHTKLIMYHEDRRVTDRAMLCAMMDMTIECSVAFHDEPYPYVIPMNFGYHWNENDQLVIDLHMAEWGHKIDLLERDPHVAIEMHKFYDRRGQKPYRNEAHDYRCVMVYGTAKEITDEPEAFATLDRIARHTGRPPLVRIPPGERKRMRLFQVTADQVTGKAQYPISTLEEVPIPIFEK